METNNNQETNLMIHSGFRMRDISEMKGWKTDLVHLRQEVLVRGLDYGEIPGVTKPSLLKPGAEKLINAYNYEPYMDQVEAIFDRKEMYVDFTFKCTIKDQNGKVKAQCQGNVSSEEIKYKYVWVSENEVPVNLDKSLLKRKDSTISEFCFGVEKAETGGKYGKPAEYWNKFKSAIADGTAARVQRKTKNGFSDAWEIKSSVYRIPNPDILGLKNTISKMAQKRAFVGAVLIATGASEFFTQDIEDMEINGVIHSDSPDFIDVGFTVVENEVNPKVSNIADKKQSISLEKLKESVEKSFSSVNNFVGELREKAVKYAETYPQYINDNTDWFNTSFDRHKARIKSSQGSGVVDGSEVAEAAMAEIGNK